MSDAHAHGGSEGDLLAGKYRVIGSIATGGMGRVVKAHHEVLGRDVAIKLMRHEFCDSEDARRRFHREARAAGRIQSDHVVTVFDVDARDDGTLMIVMEFLEGRDLAAVVDEDPLLPIDTAVGYVAEALFGLHAAHELDLVHRDLKPSNLFLARQANGSERIKLLDFGISKALGGVLSDVTKSGETAPNAIIGTPRYMSPEQISSPTECDARTDIWAVGVILHELLTQTHPFGNAAGGALLAKIVTASAPPPSARRDTIPKALDEVIGRCLERDPNARPRHAQELLALLAPFCAEPMQLRIADHVAPPRPVEDDGGRDAVVIQAEADGRSPEPAANDHHDDGVNAPNVAATLTTMMREPSERKEAGSRWRAAVPIVVALVVGASIASWVSRRSNDPVAQPPTPAATASNGLAPRPAEPVRSAAAETARGLHGSAAPALTESPRPAPSVTSRAASSVQMPSPASPRGTSAPPRRHPMPTPRAIPKPPAPAPHVPPAPEPAPPPRDPFDTPD